MIRQVIEGWHGAPENIARDCVVAGCALAVLFSVVWSFINYHARRPVVRRQRSIVDTFTMLLFFVQFSWLLRRESAAMSASWSIRAPALVAGLALVLVGAAVNVVGRLQLGRSWANQIEIYEGHQLRTAGLFRLVRHPLYASLIWMFLGAAIAFLNWAALAATLFIFIPAMHLRASQEEKLLLSAFPEYRRYRESTGEFFPRLNALQKAKS